MSSFLRSRLVLAILASLVLCGYAGTLVECCHPSSTTEETDHHDQTASANVADCHCVCHSSHLLQPLAMQLPGVNMIAEETYLPNFGEFPPDALPHGIDYPPQLV